MNSKHIGSSLNDFLIEEGIYAEVTKEAVTRVVNWQISQAMEEQHIPKTAMAKKMRTSISELDRLLKADKSIALQTLEKAASVLDRRLDVNIVDKNVSH